MGAQAQLSDVWSYIDVRIERIMKVQEKPQPYRLLACLALPLAGDSERRNSFTNGG